MVRGHCRRSSGFRVRAPTRSCSRFTAAGAPLRSKPRPAPGWSGGDDNTHVLQRGRWMGGPGVPLFPTPSRGLLPGYLVDCSGNRDRAPPFGEMLSTARRLPAVIPCITTDREMQDISHSMSPTPNPSLIASLHEPGVSSQRPPPCRHQLPSAELLLPNTSAPVVDFNQNISNSITKAYDTAIPLVCT